MKKIAIFLSSILFLFSAAHAMRDGNANNQPVNKKTILGFAFVHENSESYKNENLQISEVEIRNILSIDYFDEAFERDTEELCEGICPLGEEEIAHRAGNSKSQNLEVATGEGGDNTTIDVTGYFNQEYFNS